MGTDIVTIHAGDTYYANLSPTRGTEQQGFRPVTVISVAAMGPRAIVVPLTTKLRLWPTRIRVNLHGIEADAMCEQVRTIDLVRLSEDLYARLDPAILRDIQQTVARLIGVY